ncbi:UDP-glucose dehydrogenase [Melghirimyces profundicolus]|uniref:UDP-glucose 6-dehydrogenase n=1 Tax=Melghirimyces profundicolus TaxID=1242148 RepID=A0A2T6AY33_9BACL|nr:UDP-glucose/GDP-mannose dehydrogenase family protein [Melghirimyces profundicolus]PTX48717.1 UDP-glucose dehydrogenase [Melghirimyces profundicolus]
MNIAVIGTGYVGLTTALMLCELNHQVVCADTHTAKLKQLKSNRLPLHEPGLKEVLNRHLSRRSLSFTSDTGQAVRESDILFITVGTPSKSDGFTDLNQIKKVAETIGLNQNGYKIVVNKSTAPVGTCQNIHRWILKRQPRYIPVDVVCNPEFLREGSALYDALHPDRIVIGSDNTEAARSVRDLYDSIPCPKMMTGLRTAELIKYSANAFLAMKISFINEIARLCDSHGVDVADVSTGIGLDRRIGSRFLKAGIGWGGSCFPKDLASLGHMFEQAGLSPRILQAVRQVNETQVEYYLRRLEERLGDVRGKTISILGIAFKPDTDDIREAPAIKVIQALHQKGAFLRAYDPVVFRHRNPAGLPVTVCGEMSEAFEDSDCIFLMTEWKNFLHFDWKSHRHRMRTPLIIDGRNVLDQKALIQCGYLYYGMGKAGL